MCVMQNTFFMLVQVVFTGLFLATLALGAYLVKNDRRLFGADATMPSENSSARTYCKVQVFAVWAHVLFLTGAFAVLVH